MTSCHFTITVLHHGIRKLEHGSTWSSREHWRDHTTAVYGISAITFLISVYKAYQGEVCREFVLILGQSAQLLQDVHILGLKIQKHRNLSVSKIRTASLRFQLEDCINDLKKWQSIIKQLARSKFDGNNMMRIKLFFQKAFDIKNAFALTFSDARRTIWQRFDQHQIRIGTALSLFQV